MIHFNKNNLMKNLRTYYFHYLLYILLICFFVYSENEIPGFLSRPMAIHTIILLFVIKIFTDGFFVKKNNYDNSMLHELINHSPLLSYVLSTDGEFLFGNARAERFFRTGIDITLDGEHIDLVLDKLTKEEMKETCQVLTTGECLKTEKPIMMSNGDLAWYLIHKIPLRDSRGKIYAIANFSRNIDTEKRLQAQRETYIATLSHDLKTPTIAQVRALELLLSGQMGTFNKDQREILQLTLDSCNYMYEMVYTLLSTCKFENGSIVLNYIKVNMIEVITESIKELDRLAKENFINISFKSDKCNSYIIDADRIELKRVVVNLLSNAINYANKNSEVKISISNNQDTFFLLITNTSPYIEPDVMSNLFRKYVSHSQKYNKVGTGLGLYLSKKIVDAHFGQIIALSSKTNQTNSFGFSIPIKKTNKHNSEQNMDNSQSLVTIE